MENNEHKELEIFYKLLEQTPLADISHTLGDSTKLITRVEIGKIHSSLIVTYTNIRTTYEIRYKGVYIKSDEIENSILINAKISEIISDKIIAIQKEFYDLPIL
jgi:hypothetical protein